jgi:hypothetical protein
MGTIELRYPSWRFIRKGIAAVNLGENIRVQVESPLRRKAIAHLLEVDANRESSGRSLVHLGYTLHAFGFVTVYWYAKSAGYSFGRCDDTGCFILTRNSPPH